MFNPSAFQNNIIAIIISGIIISIIPMIRLVLNETQATMFTLIGNGRFATER